MQEAEITFDGDILIKSGIMHEIQLFMPALNFVYSEELRTVDYVINRQILWRSIVMSFYPSNIGDDITNEKKISVGFWSNGSMWNIHDFNQIIPTEVYIVDDWLVWTNGCNLIFYFVNINENVNWKINP